MGKNAPAVGRKSKPNLRCVHGLQPKRDGGAFLTTGKQLSGGPVPAERYSKGPVFEIGEKSQGSKNRPRAHKAKDQRSLVGGAGGRK